MRGSYEQLPCPFCREGIIQAQLFKGAWQEKRSGRNSLGSGKSTHRSSDTWLIQSGCKPCDKTEDQVEKELRRRNMI